MSCAASLALALAFALALALAFAFVFRLAFPKASLASSAYTPAALQAEIRNLPRAPVSSSRMFSGYIDVRPRGGKIFYWFVEAERNAAKAPVILWTNGGPGCSGLLGLLSEQGPFRVQEDGESLAPNRYAWSTLANVVFIEQPVGVGFSTVGRGEDIKYGDQQAAEDLRSFVISFFNRFPGYRWNDFYLSAESYGGHYMPMLAKLLVDRFDVPNFRGIFLGNPATSSSWVYGFLETAWAHQILPRPLWEKFQKSCFVEKVPENCEVPTLQILDIIIDSNVNLYALDACAC